MKVMRWVPRTGSPDPVSAVTEERRGKGGRRECQLCRPGGRKLCRAFHFHAAETGGKLRRRGRLGKPCTSSGRILEREKIMRARSSAARRLLFLAALAATPPAAMGQEVFTWDGQGDNNWA